MIKLSFLNLFRRKSRTFLALLGIVIGVAAIVSLVSVVDGLYSDFNEVIAAMQAVMVREKDVADEIFSRIDDKYTNKLERIPGVKNVVPEIWEVSGTIKGGKLRSNNGSSFMSTNFIYGVDIGKYYYGGQDGWIGPLKSGKELKPGDDEYVLIGSLLADDYEFHVNSTIEIKEKKYKVKGIIDAESEYLGGAILMDIEEVRELTKFPKDFVSTYRLELDNPSEDAKIAEIVNFKFTDDLEALSSSDYTEQFDSILGNLRLMVFFVAAISAIVAGIGISNTVLMSILERSQEIGTLKAVGWSNDMVMKMIIFESLFLGVIGGIIGIILGILLSNVAAEIANLSIAITPELIIEAFLFAVIVGVISGIYPAFRASKLDPIEAIRG